MLVTTNSVKEDSYFNGLASTDSLIDLIMTDNKISVIKKDKAAAGKPISDNVIKHFILTTAPTQQNHKQTLNTISLVSRIDQLTKARDASRPITESRFSNGRPSTTITKRLTNQPEVFKRSVSPHSRTVMRLSSPQDRAYERMSETETSSPNNLRDKSPNPEKRVNNEKVNIVLVLWK